MSIHERTPSRRTPRKPAVLVFVNSAQAQSYNNGGPCGPERTIDALANAVIRIAPIFRKPRAAPVETTGVAPASPPAPQPSMTREGTVTLIGNLQTK